MGGAKLPFVVEKVGGLVFFLEFNALIVYMQLLKAVIIFPCISFHTFRRMGQILRWLGWLTLILQRFCKQLCSTYLLTELTG